MRAKIRQILEECIETGIESGYLRAHKHNDNPYAFHIYEQIENAIWLEIDQRFDFERNLCNEIMEGFEHMPRHLRPKVLHELDQKRSHEQFLDDLDDWAKSDKREWVGLTWDEMSQIIEDFYTPALLSQLCRAIEANLKRKNQ